MLCIFLHWKQGAAQPMCAHRDDTLHLSWQPPCFPQDCAPACCFCKGHEPKHAHPIHLLNTSQHSRPTCVRPSWQKMRSPSGL